MYFKSMEMRGFKSFADETRIEFEPGVTAIVGPNGCGKSNIADGIRWVLGEQSARQMRGVKMEDFIFNGSSTRKKTGFAEVSLTITETAGTVTAQPYAEYDEITVTRKLYRTGESEYFINKVPCRMKDIVDIFLDTGISTRSLSIIEQAQVNRIVNSKPMDRRFIIEEAAGVMKYKSRRNAALNKLAGAQQNLLRIQDILGELERQRNSLNRQAKKAERYKTFRGEIRDKALAAYAHEYQRLTADQQRIDAQLALLREAEASSGATLATTKNEAETLKNQIADAERHTATLREERHVLLSTIERNDHHRQLLAEQLDELGENHNRALTEIGQLQAEIVKAGDELTLRTEAVTRLESDINTVLQKREERSTEAEAIRQKLTLARQERSRLGDEAVDAMRQTASRESNRSSAKAKREMAESRHILLQQRDAESSAAIEAVVKRLSDITLRLAESEKRATTVRERHDSVTEKLAVMTSKLTESDELLRDIENSAARLESRLESLRELDRNMEGFGEGVKNLFSIKKEQGAGEDEAPNLTGLLADAVKIPASLEKALATVLGDRLQAVIVEDAGAARKAIELLRNRQAGRAGFFAADLAPAGPEQTAPLHDSLLGRAIDLVTLDSAAPAAARTLLRDIWVAKDLEGALEIWRQLGGGASVVTVDGDTIDSDGLVTGGDESAGDGAGIVFRKRSIEELSIQVVEAALLRDERRVERDALRVAVEHERGELARCGESLREVEREVAEQSAEQRRDVTEQERVEREHIALLEELRETGERAEALRAEEQQLSQELAEWTTLREERDIAAAAARETCDELQRSLDESSLLLNEEELKLTRLRGELNSVQLDMRRIEEGRTDLTARVTRLKNSIGDFGRRKEEMQVSIESLIEENVDFHRQKDEVSGRIEEASGALSEKIEISDRQENDIRRLEKELDEMRQGIADTAVKKSEVDLRVENSVEKADNEFNIPEEDLLAADLDGVDHDEVTRRLQFLRNELGRIGDVNMSALEEFEEVDQRFTHMRDQHADLVKSIANLRKTIDGINATTKKLFDETFKEVAANFEAVFTRLFEGGRAELLLVQEEGELEPGVDIVVQPPGKKVQNINLLSAGEKALTAISLLFAVFLRRPSPFCLLDEIDAPLDEANIFRFRDMLMEMREHTQFIIITHSQKTMSFADRLYGVTQEEDGVSKVLTVDLQDHRHDDYSLSAA